MSKTVICVIALVVVNGFLPDLAADLTQRGADPLAVHGVAALGTAIALSLNALDPIGKVRRLIEGLNDAPTPPEPVQPQVVA